MGFELISRSEAIRLGSTTYFTGRPCPHGHIDLRFVSSYGCRECMRIKSKAVYDQDPAGQSARVSEYQKRTRPERTRANNRWRKKHPLHRYISNVNGHAKRRGATGQISVEEWSAMLERYNHTCLCCGRDDVKITADHVISIADGGENSIDNIQPLCLQCNQAKHRRVIDYRKDWSWRSISARRRPRHTSE